jgi:acyl carrier protein
MVTGGEGAGATRIVDADRERLAHGAVVDRGPAADSSSVRRLVSCGVPLGDQQVLIVDPKTGQPLPSDAVGEIWVRGESVAAGYWNHPESLDETFGGRTADGRGPFLRTGDLGAWHDGELYITGRLKDIVIIRGRNLYPQDIERAVQGADNALEGGAAFSVGEPGHEELVVVHQMGRERRHDNVAPIIRAIRAAIVEEHEVDPLAIVLLRPGALPLTSSGKIQRRRCRELFEAGELDALEHWTRPAEPLAAASQNGRMRPEFLDQVARHTPETLAVEVRTWMLGWMADKVGMDAAELSPEATFAELGIDSLTAVELNLEFEKVLGLRLPPAAAWSYPTPAALSQFLAESMLGVATLGGANAGVVDSWFAAMDADIQR